jgi:hypothetical protein
MLKKKGWKGLVGHQHDRGRCSIFFFFFILSTLFLSLFILSFYFLSFYFVSNSN